jgi:hypothetical protein
MSQDPPQSPEPNPPQPAPDPFKPKQPSSPTKAQALKRLASQLWEIWLAVLPVLVEQSRKLWQVSLQTVSRIWSWWTATLPKLRTVLPAAWSAKLSDRALTAIATSILFFLLWTPLTLLSGKSAAVAKSSQPSNAPALTAPAETSAPTPDLSPDPDRITAIQDQVAEVTSQYADGLIQSIQANFRRGRLKVNVSDDWYTLESSRQDQLANELLQRSHQLEFEKLEITDAAGTLLARSPVVGKSMVVLERGKAEVEG